jgi:SAM-dependent methyltransferase
MMRCPICGSGAGFLFNIDGVPLLRCQNKACGFRFLDLEQWTSPYVDADYFDDWTPGPINETLPWVLARIDIVRRFKRNGIAVDLGCGIGETAVALSNAGFSVTGVEESTKTIAFLKQQYPSVEWINQSILDFAAGNGGRFDVVTLFHVLEHIPHPENAIRLVDRLLRDDGVIVIEVPDVEGGLARLSGKKWGYFVRHHVNYFSARSLQNLMRQFGYRRRFLSRTYHFSHPQGHWLKDPVKGALAGLGLNSIIRTAWTK